MATLIDKYSIEKMIDRYQKELDQLFAEQETLKVKANPFRRLKAKGGLDVPEDYRFNTAYNADDYIALEEGNNPGIQNVGQYLNTAEPTQSPKGVFNFRDKFDIFLANAADKLKNADWDKIGNSAMQMASPMYNIVKGLSKPTKTLPKYNPYNDYIRSLMRNRRFNIDPLLNKNLVANAVANKNISNVARSRGELMSNLGAAQNYRMTGDMAAYAHKDNMDNQYMAEEAQMDYGVGRDISQMDWGTQIANEQNKAARNQFLGQGMVDFGQFAQVQQQMKNQKGRDQQLAGIWQDSYPFMSQFMPNVQSIVDYANQLKTT